MTTGIKNWSSTPGDNDAPAPNGWPEGMPPSGVNDSGRQMMAEVRKWYEDLLWVDLGSAGLLYLSATSFRVSGDQTGQYQVGRRIRAIGTTPFTIYGEITASSFSASNTDVTVEWDSGSLNNTLSEVAIGSDVSTKPISSKSITFGDGDIPASAVSGGTKAESSNYTVTVDDQSYLITVDASGAARTITLPAAADVPDGFEVTIKRISSGANNVIVSATIDGTANRVLRNQYDAETYVSDQTAWRIKSRTVKGLLTRTYIASGSGNFTVPDGVTNVRILGAGGGGGGGSYNNDATNGGDTTVTYSATTYTANGGIGGTYTAVINDHGSATNGDINLKGGGSAGGVGSTFFNPNNGYLAYKAGGNGGLFIKDLAVSPGDTIAYVIGTGGTGAVFNPVGGSGANGGNGVSGYIILEY